jgi:hypothetical protein
MRVQVSDARFLRDLLAYLRACDCVVEQASSTEADVSFSSASPRAARMELDVYLTAWSIRHQDVAARVTG